MKTSTSTSASASIRAERIGRGSPVWLSDCDLEEGIDASATAFAADLVAGFLDEPRPVSSADDSSR